MSDTQPPAPPPPPPDPPPPDPPPPDPDAIPDDPEARAQLVKELRRENAGHRQKLREAEAARDKAIAKSQTEAERALAEAKAQGAQEARGELEGEILSLEIRAAAGGRLRDAEDAVLHLRGQLEGQARGPERARAIDKAITDLLEARPYLAAEKGNGTGSASGAGLGQGARGGKPGASADDWLRAARRR